MYTCMYHPSLRFFYFPTNWHPEDFHKDEDYYYKERKETKPEKETNSKNGNAM